MAAPAGPDPARGSRLRMRRSGASPSQRLFVLFNAALVVTSLFFAVGIVGTLRHVLPVPAPRSLPSGPSSPARLDAPADGRETPVSTEIAVGNLFDPQRLGRSAPQPTSSSSLVLQGVVVDGATGRAFIEEPNTRRVAGFSVGDMVAGGAIQQIADDRVIIATPTGLMEILLRDPSRPKPALEPAVRTAAALGPSTLFESKVSPPSPQAPEGTPTLGRRIRGRVE